MQKTKKLNRYQKHLGKMVISATFLALAVVINTFTEIAIPLFGGDGMQMKLGGIFTAFPAFLFGPIYGGLVCAASDVIGAFIKPTGAYVPWFTITAFLAGFIKGLIFKLIKERDVKWIKAVVAILVVLSAFIGIFSFSSMKNDGIFKGFYASSADIPGAQEILDNKEGYSAPSKLAAKYAFDQCQRKSLPEIKVDETPEDYEKRLARYDVLNDGEQEIVLLSRDKNGNDQFAPSLALIANIFGPGMILVSLLGCLLLIFMIVVERKFQLGGFAPKIFLSVLAAEIVQTSINSALLINLYTTTYQNFSYALFNTPRVLEGILMSILLSYFIYVLYQVYDSKIRPKLRMI